MKKEILILFIFLLLSTLVAAEMYEMDKIYLDEKFAEQNEKIKESKDLAVQECGKTVQKYGGDFIRDFKNTLWIDRVLTALLVAAFIFLTQLVIRIMDWRVKRKINYLENKLEQKKIIKQSYQIGPKKGFWNYALMIILILVLILNLFCMMVDCRDIYQGGSPDLTDQKEISSTTITTPSTTLSEIEKYEKRKAEDNLT